MSEITDKQRAAWQWLNGNTSASLADRQALDALALLLPDALTNPQPVLPTEPGWYQGFDKVARSQVTIRLADNGNWGYGISGSTLLANPEIFAPFTRLVPERPQVTAAQVDEALHEAHVSGFSGDEWKEAFVFALLQIVNDGTRS